ncbi:hypothetical protein [Streptomyces sp. NPDC005498]|uniref:hypothetical protein n=1 Tax=Streptomyces sp. NPDC005498 TaxID=3364717 RepID=UPI0036AA7A17
MPDAKVTNTELVAQYSSQLTNDLERNTQEQDQLRGEIDKLQERLQTLQHDYGALATMRNALEGGIPLQQKSLSGDGQPSEAERAYGFPLLAAPGTSKRGQRKPTLVALIRAYLVKQAEPCSAAEVATALGEAHPDRVIKTTVVRTTLEGLVARSSAERLKQGHSVFYASLETDGAVGEGEEDDSTASSEAGPSAGD